MYIYIYIHDQSLLLWAGRGLYVLHWFTVPVLCVKQKLSPPPAPKRTVVLEKHVSIEIATTWGVDTRKYPMEPVVGEISIFET